MADVGASVGKVRPMLTVVAEDGSMRDGVSLLDEVVREGAQRMLAAALEAEDHAQAAIRAFDKVYGAKFPKAVKKVTDDEDVLLAYHEYPAEHCIHLRTTNPIESTFATVRLRTKVTKGAGSRAAGLAMTFKLIESAQSRWRAVDAPHLVVLARAGACFERGILLERQVAAA